MPDDSTPAPIAPTQKPKRKNKLRRVPKIPATVTNGQAARLTALDCEAIIKLVCRGLNESEACAHLGIKRERWFNWKSIHASEYVDMFSRLKAARINSLLGSIEQVGEVDKALERGLRYDWRASHMLLACTAPDRFANKPSEQQQPQTVLVTVSKELASLCYPVQDAEVIADKPAPLALPSPTP